MLGREPAREVKALQREEIPGQRRDRGRIDDQP